MRIAPALLVTIGINLTALPILHAESNTTATTESKAKPAEPAPLFQMHYENRVRSFKEQNLAFQNVVLLGDSITEGFDVTKYLPGRRVINRGIGADVIGNELPSNDKRGVLKRLDSSVFDCSPTDLFILIGINDLGQGHSPETIEAGYRDMLTRIRKHLPELNIHVQSVLPCSGRFAKHNENILDANQRIKKLAEEFACKYIDLHGRMIDDKGELKAEFTTEGLHLAEPAYRLWATVVEEAMEWN